MAYYKEPKYEEKEDDYFPFSFTDIVGYEYKLLYHEKFFEHLHMKRLVIDENIPFRKVHGRGHIGIKDMVAICVGRQRKNFYRLLKV